MNFYLMIFLFTAIKAVASQTNDSLPMEQQSMVILHEQQDPDEGILRREFEHLKIFLSNNMPVVTNPMRTISSWITAPIRRLWSRNHNAAIAERRVTVINETLNTIYDRLIDYGFNSVGISKECRELAICNTSNYILKHMPSFMEAYGRDRLMNLPTTVFGNHDYTNAWIVGLGSAEPSFCPALFACNETLGNDNLVQNITLRTKTIPIQIDQESAYFLDKTNNKTTSSLTDQSMIISIEISDSDRKINQTKTNR